MPHQTANISVSLFRDAQDVLPRPRLLRLSGMIPLLAPSVPTVRKDIVEAAHRQAAVLERALNAALQPEPPTDWLRDHPWYRALEKEAWVTSQQGPEVMEDVVKQKALQLGEAIQRRLKTRLPCWSPAIYPPGTTRGLESVEAVSCLVLDYDDGTPIDAAIAPWEGHPLLLHSSWSHSTTCPRFRVILPLREPIPATEWAGVWRWAEERAEGEIDPACKDPSRLYLLPAIPLAISPYERRVLNLHGPLLSPKRLQARPPRQPPPRAGVDPVQAQARRVLRTSRAARERAASWLQATIRSNRAEHIRCPQCGRSSVWFWLEPGTQITARCNHRNSCGWWGHLDTLLNLHGRYAC